MAWVQESRGDMTRTNAESQGTALLAPDTESGESGRAPGFIDRRSHDQSAFQALRPVVWMWGLGLAFWSVLVLQPSVPVADLIEDSGSLGVVPWYDGLVSNVGVLLWAITVCACAITAFVAHHGGRGGACDVFRGAAVFFGFLLLDDLFLIHTHIIPHLVPIHRHNVMLAEGVLGLMWLIPSWPEVQRTRWHMLVAAGLALGTSIAVDIFIETEETGVAVLIMEDGSKFFGGAALATWATVTAADVIRSTVLNR